MNDFHRRRRSAAHRSRRIDLGAGSVEERDHLVFRDYLRAHPFTAAEYLELKRTLAAAHDGLSMQSQEDYSLSKSDFVRRVLQAAAGFSLPD